MIKALQLSRQVRMPALTFRYLCYAGLAVAALLPVCALAESAGTYLTWQNKTSPASEPQQGDEPSPAMAYPAPPSPYGQVGDPFRRNLNWPSKKTPQAVPQPAPKPQATSEGSRPYQPAPVKRAPDQPVQAVASRPETLRSVTVQPLPPSKPVPQVTAVEPAPPPPPMLSVAKPPPAPQVHEPHKATASLTAPTPLPAAKPVVVPPQAVAAAPTPKPQSKPAPQPAAAPEDGYQVPATSKYAAQLKAARAREAANDQATAPEPSEQLAVHETDHVFIPGETYKDEGDAPRLYSLHRMYGLQPDPITVSPDATGAILDGADLHADEAPKTPAKDGAKAPGPNQKESK
jgi:hypothetical protein